MRSYTWVTSNMKYYFLCMGPFFISTGVKIYEQEWIVLITMLVYWFLQNGQFSMSLFLSYIRHSMLYPLNYYTIYISTMYKINSVELIFLPIMLAYFSIPVISIHDGLTLIFSRHFMLSYLYENMIYTSNWFTTKIDKLITPTTMLSYWFIYIN